MKDIENREDLEKLLEDFYKVAIVDEMIGAHFNDLDLKSHLPVITDFWVKTLFGEPVYFGNPMFVHKILHDKRKLETKHFERWLQIFCQTIDRTFEGQVAENAKSRANVIAKSMDMRLNSQENPYINIEQ